MSGASFGDDRGHPDAAATHNRTALRLRRRQRGCGLPTAGPRRGLRLRPGHAGPLRLPASRQARQGRGSQVPRRRDGHLASADGAPGPAVARDRRGPGPPRRQPGAAVRAQVHGGGHPAAGGGRRGLRADVRAGHARGPAAPVRGVRGRALRAPRDDLQRPRLQPARLRDVPREAHRVDEDAGDGRGHRPAPGPGARGPAGTRARGHRPPGGTATASRAST